MKMPERGKDDTSMISTTTAETKTFDLGLSFESFLLQKPPEPNRGEQL